MSNGNASFGPTFPPAKYFSGQSRPAAIKAFIRDRQSADSPCKKMATCCCSGSATLPCCARTAMFPCCNHSPTRARRDLTTLSPTPRAGSLPAPSGKRRKAAACIVSSGTARSAHCSPEQAAPTAWAFHQTAKPFIGPVRPRARYFNLITTKLQAALSTKGFFIEPNPTREFPPEWRWTPKAAFGRPAGEELAFCALARLASYGGGLTFPRQTSRRSALAAMTSINSSLLPRQLNSHRTRMPARSFKPARPFPEEKSSSHGYVNLE